MVTAGVAALLVAGCSGAEPSGDVQEGPGGPDATRIVADDAFFEPETLELETGTEATVEVTNEGGAPHDFTIEELDLSSGTIEPGSVVTARFTVPEGETPFECTIHSGMEGVITAS
jgi:plastocyanin